MGLNLRYFGSVKIARIAREDTTGYRRGPISAVLALVLVGEKYTVGVVPYSGGVTAVSVILVCGKPRWPSRPTTAWSNRGLTSPTGPGATGTRTFGTCDLSRYTCAVGASSSWMSSCCCLSHTECQSRDAGRLFIRVRSLTTSTRIDIGQLNVFVDGARWGR